MNQSGSIEWKEKLLTKKTPLIKVFNQVFFSCFIG